METSKKETKESLALDVAALRRQLGPVKVALIEQWIREVNGPLNDLIQQAISPGARVLDIGCSRGDPDLPAMYQDSEVVGCDVDRLGLRANKLAQHRALAPMGHLPFAEASFDLLVCKWVLEHLEHPEAELGECLRVLKPGGRLVFLTPNKYSFFTFMSILIPYRLKQILKGNMFAIHEEDTFRTWYRANSRAQLQGLRESLGWEEEAFIQLAGMWTFFIFFAPLARLVRRLEFIQLRIPGLRATSTYFIATWRKPEN